MEEEAPNELIYGECHGLVPGTPLGAVVFPTEGDPLFIQRNQLAVSDGNPIRVAGKIGQYRSRSGKQPFKTTHLLCHRGLSHLVKASTSASAWC